MKSLGLLLFCLFSCSPAPEPFRYGTDKCTMCHKPIQNMRSGGELITGKGQVLKFHSVECLLKYYKIHENTNGGYTWIQVIDYDEPGVLINVNDAVFMKQTNVEGWTDGNLIAVSKKEYSNIYLKAYRIRKGMYWDDVLWSYP